MSVIGREFFPKAARLRKRHEYLKLARTGKKYHSHNFLIIQASNNTRETRLGITVSGKVGNAVVRNSIKRRIREFFRRRRYQMPSGLDVLVIARKGAGELPSHEIAKELRRGLIQP